VSLVGFGQGDSSPFAKRREQVKEINQRIGLLSDRNARPAHDKRDAHTVVIKILLAHQTMLTNPQAVVGGINDKGIIAQVLVVQGRQDATDFGIHVRNHAIIIGNMPPNRGLCARIIRQHFVADVADAELKGMLGHEVRRQFNLVRLVHAVIGRGRGARIMRRGKGDIGEERVIVRLMRVEEVDDVIGEQGGREAVGDVGRLRVIDASRVEVVNRHSVLVGHAAKKCPAARAEAAGETVAAVVPFASAEGRIAMLPQQFGQERYVLWQRVGRGEEVAAAHQHPAAGHAHRAGCRAHDVRLGEGRAVCHHLVKGRRRHLFHAQTIDGGKAMVISNHQQDIGSGHLVCL